MARTTAAAVPLSREVVVADLGAAGQLAQAAPVLGGAVAAADGAADGAGDGAADGEAVLQASAPVLSTAASPGVQTSGDLAAVLAPLLVGGSLLAGVLGLSAQERRRRLTR